MNPRADRGVPGRPFILLTTKVKLTTLLLLSSCQAHTEQVPALHQDLTGSGGGIAPEFRCMDLGLPATVRCDRSICTITHCGTGKCRFCPEGAPDGVKNLVVKAWGSYSCLAGSTFTGSAFGFIPIIGNTFVGPFCVGIGPGTRELAPPSVSSPHREEVHHGS